MKKESAWQSDSRKRHLANEKKNRAALNSIIKDIKAGKPIPQDEQLKLALLAAWALFQGYPVLWEALDQSKDPTRSKIFQAIWHFTKHWGEEKLPRDKPRWAEAFKKD
jgi:hypothetical protein